MGLLQAPRGPVTRLKSGTVDYTDKYERKIQNFRYATREQAQRQLEENREWANISKYIGALEGKFWDRSRASYRSRFHDNQLARARKECLALYTDVRPSIAVKAANKAYEEIGGILTNTILHEWSSQNWDMTLGELIDHAMLSVGYLKISAGANRLNAAAFGMDTVMPVNSTSNLQESSAIDYMTYKPMAYFFHRFGKDKAAKVAKSPINFGRAGDETYTTGMGMTEYTYNNLSPAMKRLMRTRKPPRSRDSIVDAFPVGQLEELWYEDISTNESGKSVIIKDPSADLANHNFWYEVKPGERLFPRKRLMVFGGAETCYDGPGPYWCDSYPFVRLALDPIVWGAGGLSKYRELYPLNMGMNEIGAGIFDTIKKAINQTYAVKRGSVADADWDRFYPDMPGAKLRMTPIGNPSSDLKALDPPQLPSYVFQFLREYLIPSFDRHAGTMDVNALSKKKQVPGGDTLEQIRDAQSGPTRLEGRRIEVALRDAGTIAVSHILQYFTRETRFHLLGADGLTWNDFDFRPRDMVPAGEAPETFWKRLSVTIAPGSLHGANKDRDFQKAVAMHARGAMSTETLLKKAEVADVDKELKRIAAERQAGIGVPAQGGGGRTPRMSRGARTGAA